MHANSIGGFHCLHDFARHLVAGVQEALDVERRGPGGKHIIEGARKDDAIDLVERELRAALEPNR